MEKVNFLSPQEVLRASQAGGRGRGLPIRSEDAPEKNFSTRSCADSPRPRREASTRIPRTEMPPEAAQSRAKLA